MRIFISAGEASGDAYGAEIVRRWQVLNPENTFEGIGGASMRGLPSFKVVADSSKWGAVGIAEAVKVGFKVLFELPKIKSALSSGEPGVFLPIDFGYLNVKLMRHAVSHGWKCYYFIPPGSWRRKPTFGEIVALSDKIVAPFGWNVSPENSAKVRWMGHPLLEMLGDTASQEREDVWGILLGSRMHEVDLMMPLCAKLLAKFEGEVWFGVAPHLESAHLEQKWKSLTGRSGDKFLPSGKTAVFKRARAALICSGTATLEAALCGCPMVILYPISPINNLQAKLMGLDKLSFGLPNILLESRVIPEFGGSDIDPRQVSKAMEDAWNEPENQLKAFEAIRELCGTNQAITEAVRWFAS